jgi:hypothetical protein
MGINEFVATYPAEIQSLVFQLRALVLAAFPGAIEQVDPPSRIIAYGTDRTYRGLMCAIAPYREHVNLMFARGIELSDPQHLLVGTGKRARHVKIQTYADLENPALLDLLNEAINLE